MIPEEILSQTQIVDKVKQKKRLSKRQKILIEEALIIEHIESLGYFVRSLAQATLPHLDPKLPPGTIYSRTTGLLTLNVVPTSTKYGIPYGTIPRLILAWICTEATRTKERTLRLGTSQKEFLEKIGLQSNGRDIARFKDQALRLFKSLISIEYEDKDGGDHSARLLISSKSHVFWSPKNTEYTWDSTLELSEEFFNEIIKSPIPINIEIYKSLSKSPLAMDIYTWLTYRMFLLHHSRKHYVCIPWAALKAQFGASYPETSQGINDFKKKFKRRLKEVLLFYTEAKDYITEEKDFLKLLPCPLHIDIKSK
jgi:hypothetical protein